MHLDTESGVVAAARNLSLKRLRDKICKFEASVDYIKYYEK